MAFFNRFPFTTYNSINLDWIIESVKQLITKVDELDTGSGSELGERVTNAEEKIETLEQSAESLDDRLSDSESAISNINALLPEIKIVGDTNTAAELDEWYDAGKILIFYDTNRWYQLTYKLGSSYKFYSQEATAWYSWQLENGIWSFYLGDSSGSVVLDSTPTAGSTNGVTSGGVYTALQNKQDTLTFDDAPTSGSINPVTSDGIYDALQDKQDTLTFDAAPTSGSINPVTSDGIYDALQDKQDTLTFDATPTSGSTNPVTSDGIYQAIQNASFLGATFDGTPTEGSTNPVTSDGIYQAIVDEIVTDTFLLSQASGATIPAESSTIFTEDISRNGYTPIGFIGYTVVGTNSEKLYINRLYISAGEALVRIYNPSSAGITLSNVRIWVLYKKEV